MRLRALFAVMFLGAAVAWSQPKVVAVRSGLDYFYSIDLKHVTVVLQTAFPFTGTKDLGNAVLLAKDAELYLFTAAASGSFLSKSDTIAPVSEILAAHYEHEKQFQQTQQGMVFDEPLRFYKRPDGLSFSGWSYRPSHAASSPDQTSKTIGFSFLAEQSVVSFYAPVLSGQDEDDRLGVLLGLVLSARPTVRNVTPQNMRDLWEHPTAP